MFKIGWFSTARGISSRILLDSIVKEINNKSLDVRIEFVFCSRERGESDNTDHFLDRVQANGIPLTCLSVRNAANKHGQQIKVPDGVVPQWRLEYDRQVMAALYQFKPDLCLLAGYMLIVGPEMCDKYNLINLHPALPAGPKGTWQEVIWDLIGSKAQESGAMMHLVTPELDRGPVITYCRYPIIGEKFEYGWQEVAGLDVQEIKSAEGENNQLFKLIRQEGFVRETPLIIQTLKAFSIGEIKVDGKKLKDSSGAVIPGYDVTSKIDVAILGS